jgi:hypothetical protein
MVTRPNANAYFDREKMPRKVLQSTGGCLEACKSTPLFYETLNQDIVRRELLLM